MRKIAIIVSLLAIMVFILFSIKKNTDVKNKEASSKITTSDPVIITDKINTENSGDRLAEINGLKVRYKISGKAQNPTLMLIHGFTSSLETWDWLVPELSKDFQVIRFDAAGHGLTGPDPKNQYSHNGRVETVLGLMQYLNLEKPTIIGNSMGGNTAWRVAALHPDKVNKLVLIDASGFPLNGLSEKPLEINPAMKNYLITAPKAIVSYAVNGMYADPTKIPTTRIDQIVDMMQQDGNGEAFVNIFETFTLPDPTTMLNNISAPTLILWGAKDATVPPEHAALFNQAIPNSEVFIFENVGHVPQEEEPQLTANKIIEFINKGD